MFDGLKGLCIADFRFPFHKSGYLEHTVADKRLSESNTFWLAISCFCMTCYISWLRAWITSTFPVILKNNKTKKVYGHSIFIWMFYAYYFFSCTHLKWFTKTSSSLIRNWMWKKIRERDTYSSTDIIFFFFFLMFI